MAENETPADQVRSVLVQNLEQAHKAIANCFEFFEKSIASSPLGARDQTKTFRSYVEQRTDIAEDGRANVGGELLRVLKP